MTARRRHSDGGAGATEAGPEAKTEMAQLLALHQPQLEASPIPRRHWRSMLRKMAGGQLDAGETFALTPEEDGGPLKAVVITEEGVKVGSSLMHG